MNKELLTPLVGNQLKAWKFLVGWILLTNIGFFSGLSFGSMVGNLFEDKLVQSVVSGLVIGMITGLSQGIILRKVGMSLFGWMSATGIGWMSGIFISGVILFSINPLMQSSDFFKWVLPSSFISGAVVAVPQYLAFKKYMSKNIYKWMMISSVGWGIQFPGVITGLFLVKWLKEEGELL